MNNNKEISIEQVRAVVEMLAREHNLPLTEITLKSVQYSLGSGSNGTIGALLRVVRSEYIQSKQFDRLSVSNHLKSAYNEEINRLIDNARECSSEEMSALNNLNNELTSQNREAEAEISNLKCIIEKKDEQENVRYQDLIKESAKTEQNRR